MYYIKSIQQIFKTYNLLLREKLIEPIDSPKVEEPKVVTPKVVTPITFEEMKKIKEMVGQTLTIDDLIKIVENFGAMINELGGTKKLLEIAQAVKTIMA